MYSLHILEIDSVHYNQLYVLAKLKIFTTRKIAYSARPQCIKAVLVNQTHRYMFTVMRDASLVYITGFILFYFRTIY